MDAEGGIDPDQEGGGDPSVAALLQDDRWGLVVILNGAGGTFCGAIFYPMSRSCGKLYSFKHDKPDLVRIFYAG
jgi:hypothetical protein